ncbi:MAG: ribonuclease HII [bacterium]|nr:ribonuclease HII [bacterium]
MIGVDEVGRGCLAGPLLVVAARAKNELPLGLKDSKLLTRLQRETIYKLLTTKCDFGEGWVTSAEIDKSGMANAMRLGIARALKNLGVLTNDKIILDGSVNYLPKKFINFQCLIDADALVPLVSAASIYAKVRRDRYMIELAKKHDGYGFENHVGYFTAQHKLALKNLGPLKSIHRMSFRPLKGAL